MNCEYKEKLYNDINKKLSKNSLNILLSDEDKINILQTQLNYKQMKYKNISKYLDYMENKNIINSFKSIIKEPDIKTETIELYYDIINKKIK